MRLCFFNQRTLNVWTHILSRASRIPFRKFEIDGIYLVSVNACTIYLSRLVSIICSKLTPRSCYIIAIRVTHWRGSSFYIDVLDNILWFDVILEFFNGKANFDEKKSDSLKASRKERDIFKPGWGINAKEINISHAYGHSPYLGVSAPLWTSCEGHQLKLTVTWTFGACVVSMTDTWDALW